MTAVSSQSGNNEAFPQADQSAAGRGEAIGRVVLSVAGLSIVLVCAVALAWGMGRANGMW